MNWKGIRQPGRGRAPLRTLVALCAALLFATSKCEAQIVFVDLPDLIVVLPDLTLLPNTPGQSFDIFVQNNGAEAFSVTGIGFNLQVADGGPELPGRSIDGPAISSVDIFSGTPFESNNNGLSGGSISPQIFERGTLTLAGTVEIATGSSKLATVVFDTTGFSSGTFTYTMDTWNGPLKYTTTSGDVFPGLLDGNLAVIPEPSEYAAAFGLACLGWVAISRTFRRKH